MQKTAYEMRISEWSSDVCSSDLCSAFRLAGPAGGDLRERFACPQRNGGGEERQQQFATLHASRAHYLPSSNSGSAILANSSAGSFETARSSVSKPLSSPSTSLVSVRSEEHTTALPSLMSIYYAVFSLTKTKSTNNNYK